MFGVVLFLIVPGAVLPPVWVVAVTLGLVAVSVMVSEMALRRIAPPSPGQDVPALAAMGLLAFPHRATLARYEHRLDASGARSRLVEQLMR